MKKTVQYSADKIGGTILSIVGFAVIIQALWIFISKFILFILGWMILNFGLKLLGFPSAGQLIAHIWFLFSKNTSGYNYTRYK